MPIPLPEGITPASRAMTDDEVLVASTRTTRWQFELLDSDEVLLGKLDGVQPGGNVDFTASASVKGGGSIDLKDAGQDIDWLNVRIRPVCTIDGYSRDIPVGVWIPSAPVENWTDLGRSWNVTLLDKATILDVDPWTHPTSGNVETYVATKGSNIVVLVRDLINQTGEATPAIDTTGGPTLARDMVFEAGTSRLKICNDLLDAAGFFSLQLDYAGQFQATPYTRPADRPPVYPDAAPFIAGPTSVWDPTFTNDLANADVPNKFICVGQADGTSAALTSIATNTNPDSPYSYPRRKNRWVARIETGVEAVDQAALDLITRRKLDAATAVSSKIDATHLFLPDLQINSVVPVKNPRANIDRLCTVTKTSVVFDALGKCSSRLQEVTA